MKKRIAGILLCMMVCAAAFAQANEGDFKIDANGTITAYEGFDKAIVIPAQIGGVRVTAIGDKVFEKSGLTSVTLPAGIARIGANSFAGNQLTSVTIPNSVTFIGGAAFIGNRLTSVTVGNGVSIGRIAFSNNALTSFTIGNGGSIGAGAFGGNPNLKNFALGVNVSFGQDIFDPYNDYAGVLTNFYRPTANMYDDYVFNEKKAGVYDASVRYNYPAREGAFEFILTKYGAIITSYPGNEAAVDIPRLLGNMPVKSINSGAFANKGLTRLRLPDGLIYIGEKAFEDNQLTSVTIPNSVTSIGFRAFEGNRLTSVTIPNSVTSIEFRAFGGNRLTSVTIPNGVTSIADSAFANNKLTSIIIPNTVTSIRANAFENNLLTNVVLPVGALSIDRYAFSRNSQLPGFSIIIPSGVSTISNGEFADRSLASVVIPNSVTSIGANAFEKNQLTSITIGANVAFPGGKVFAISKEFDVFYASNKRQAGTYIFDAKKKKWSFVK